MAWGFITIDNPGDLIFLKTYMNQHTYKKTLELSIISFINNNQTKKFILQHDEAPAYKAKMIEAWIEKQKIEIMDWAGQSQDLNPIENVWAFIKKF